MPKLDLRIRDLATGDTSNVMFENEDIAAEWIRNRPKGKVVLGVATHGLEEHVYKTLRAASRESPLDNDERAANTRIEEALNEEFRKQQAEELQREQEELEAYREQMKHADPHRPMAVRWDIESGFALDDPTDSREIPDVVREAVQAWIADRTTWIADRGQYIAEVTVSVLPGPVEPGTERVLPGGQFVPLARP